MNIKDRFLEYADAFEITYEDNDWSRLEPFFTEGAVYETPPSELFGESASGLAAVMAKLERSINGFDRLMDTRVLELTPPITEGDTVRTNWTSSYSKSGVPDLKLGGIEYARFEGDRIALLRDEPDPGTEEELASWLAQHGESLSK
ncbi:nuclear transport factor 2 family protein [Pseudomonadota bacterium]